MSKLNIGLAETVLTDGIDHRLSGYAEKRKATGVHDDIHARALVLENGSCAMAFLTVAVVDIEPQTNTAIREAVAKQTGVPADNVVVHCIHTHSAPEVKDSFENHVKDKCVECLVDAWKSRFQGRIGSGVARVKECGRNRRYLDYGGLPVDPEIGILKLEDAAGKLVGVFFNYACHCTTLGALSSLITEDWPFYAVDLIRRRRGRDILPLFFNGTCGDINPGYSASLSAVSADIPTRTWAEARRIGERVGGAVVRKLAGISTTDAPDLDARMIHCDLPGRSGFPVSIDEAKQGIADAHADLNEIQSSSRARYPRSVERAKAKVFLAELLLSGAEDFYSGKMKKSYRAGIQSFRIGDVAITTCPGEIFVEIGLKLKKQSPAHTTMVVELVNTAEAKGYMPAMSSFGEGDYEAFRSFYAEGAGDELVNASVKNLNTLWQRT